MKKYIIIIIGISFSLHLSGQSLLKIYKSGPVKLVPDTEFAKNNENQKVFESYNDFMGNTHIGARKSLVILPDGSIVVSHAYRDYYTLFDNQGIFVKEFYVSNSKGENEKKLKAIEDIIGGKIFIAGGDNLGKMRCFDLNGKLLKTLTSNYSVRDVIALDDNKLALVGWVIWKEKFRNFVAIKDYNSNEEKIIWDHFTERNQSGTKQSLFNYTARFEKAGIISYTSMPYSKSTGNNFIPSIYKIGQQLIVAVPGSGEIIAYDFNGNLLTKETAAWSPGYISVEEQREIQRNFIEKFKSKGDTVFVQKKLDVAENKMKYRITEEESKTKYQDLISQMENDLKLISEPIAKPFFSTIIKDSEDNLLFFEYPEQEGANKFNVWIYANKEKLAAKSSFICEEYELSITPGKMVFHDGYIYGLQNLKGAEGIPMRLVRFRLLPAGE